MSVSPIPGGFFLLCDSLIRSKSPQQNVVCIQLEEEAESDQDYRGGRERERGGENVWGCRRRNVQGKVLVKI